MYFEDYAPGRVIALGSATVSEDEILDFARRWDPQPFHVDAALAEQGPFGVLIASGWHTCALAMRAMVGSYLVPESSTPSPGIDELRWLAPVRAGDTLTFRATVVEATPSRSKPDRGMVKGRIEGINQHGEGVLSMVSLNIIRRRDTPSVHGELPR
jgi:acyl dehydratase